MVESGKKGRSPKKDRQNLIRGREVVEDQRDAPSLLPRFVVRISDFKVEATRWGLSFRFRVSGFGFRASGFEVRLSDFGVRVQGFDFHVSGSGFKV